MTKRRFIAIAASIVAVSIVGYSVGWHTYLGRAVRGISTVALVNRSAAPLQHVSFYLIDGRGRQIDRHFEHLQPRHTVRVGVRTSDLIVRRIVCKQGKLAFTYEPDANVTLGAVFLVSVDSQGTMSGNYEH